MAFTPVPHSSGNGGRQTVWPDRIFNPATLGFPIAIREPCQPDRGRGKVLRARQTDWSAWLYLLKIAIDADRIRA